MRLGSSIRFTVRVSIPALTLLITWRTLLRAVWRVKTLPSSLHHYNEQYPVTYRSWFESLYKDKYYYMGDAELMSTALLLDVSSYYTGLVRAVYRDPEREFLHLPFSGNGGKFVRKIMNFYGRRLTAMANRRWATGYYGKRNAGWRELYDGFVPDTRLRKQIFRGLRRWCKCELVNVALMFRKQTQAVAGDGFSAVTSAKANDPGRTRYRSCLECCRNLISTANGAAGNYGFSPSFGNSTGMLTCETVPGLNFQVRNVRRTDLSRSRLPVLCAIEALVTLPLAGSTDTTQTPLPATRWERASSG